MISLCIICDPGARPFLAAEAKLDKRDRGSLDDATYEISKL